jgi:hypothetical protein
MIAAIALTLIIAVFAPLVITHVRNEALWSTKQKRTTNAFHLAEAAVDRGLWKLTESEENWQKAITGTPITHYNNDFEYTDVAGGKYKIKITSGPSAGEVTVLAKGLATATQETRGLEAVYTRLLLESSLQTEGALEYKPNLKVHWGPVVSQTSINQAPSDYFPRKYSKGQIVGRDTVNDAVNTDGLEYWAFHKSMGPAPQVDLEYYRDKAVNSKVPVALTLPADGRIERNAGGSTLAVATPSGSGYFPASLNGNKGLRFDKAVGIGRYEFRSSTSVIYIDNDTGATIETTLRNASFLEVEGLILAGANHDLNCNADSFDNFKATIPINAQMEYQHSSAAGVWTSNFSSVGAGNCCYTIDDLGIRGYIYVGGKMGNSGGGTKIVGLVNVLGTITMNTLTVYYDRDVGRSVKYKSSAPRRVRWRELKLPW